ncbi:MAG: EamA family transporter [Candidatus Bathyarchaeota archaeon]|nr:MAG: EamA family transporter [Candidatus Bathyarchaeota archaeon]
MPNKPISLFNTFLMLTLISLWGSSFVVVKIALQEGLTPIAVATLRFLIAGGLFSIILLLNKARQPEYTILIQRKDAPIVLALALSGITLFFSIQYTGIQFAGAAMASILVCLLSPLLITAITTKILGENLTRKQSLGIIVAAFGTLTVVTGGVLDFQTDSDYLLGTLILLITPVLWTIYTILGRRILSEYSPFLLVANVTVMGGLFLIPISVLEDSFFDFLSLSTSGWLAVLFLSTTCSLIGYCIWFRVLRDAGPAVTSAFLFAEPVVTSVMAALLVGERLTAPLALGGTLIFFGVFLVTKYL